ncbi:MAG TPA: hypothetical protein VG672_19480 [Bryobacteraceae bacterium]|nr:hypothetical protein [Bryobacteraceae bacterium]
MDASKPTEEQLSGMTVNERLGVCKLYDQWLKSARERNREEMIAVLTRVAFTGEQAGEIVDKVLAEPGRFGF